MALMSGQENDFPCPGCGFEVFSQPPGSYEICELCGWEDDHVQLRFPAMSGGANKASLAEHQREALLRYPLTMSSANGLRRAPGWRPLRPGEIVSPQSFSGTDYFDAAADGAPQYYWLRNVSG